MIQFTLQNEEIDYLALRKELLRALRGRRTQGQINQLLHKNYAQAYRWESGRKKMYWNDFLVYCQACRQYDAMANSLRQITKYQGDLHNDADLLHFLLGGTKASRFIKKTGCSKGQAYRWLAGDSEVPLEIILKSMHIFDKSMFAFLFNFVDLSKLPSVAEWARHEKLENDFYHSHPLSAAILVALTTPQYKRLYQHDNHVIAKLTGEPLHVIDDYIETMTKLGMIQQKGGKLYVSERSLNIYSNPRDEYKVRDYWTQRASRKLQKADERLKMSKFGFRIFAMDKQRYEHVMQRLSSVYQDMMSSIREELPDETEAVADDSATGETKNKAPAAEKNRQSHRVFAFNVQLFNLEDNETEF